MSLQDVDAGGGRTGTPSQTPVNRLAFRMAFREWFGLRPTAADVLAKLYGAAGGFLTSDEIASGVGALPSAMRFHLSQVRQALESEALDSEQGRGYRLSEIGMAECRSAIATIGEELRLAG